MTIHQYIRVFVSTIVGILVIVLIGLFQRQFPWTMVIVYLGMVVLYIYFQYQRQWKLEKTQELSQQKLETSKDNHTVTSQEIQKKLKYARKRNRQIVINLHKRNKSRKRRIREETIAQQRSELIDHNFHIEKFAHSPVSVWLHLVSPTGVKISIFNTLAQGKLDEETVKKFTVSLRSLKDQKQERDSPTKKKIEILSKYTSIVQTIEKDKRIQSLLQSLTPYIISGVITTEHIPTVRFHLNDLSLSKLLEMAQLVDYILNLNDFNQPVSKIYGCISDCESETCVCNLPECFICRSKITCTEDSKVLQCCYTYVHTEDIEIWLNKHNVCPYCKSSAIKLERLIIG